jgi:hypothetical protein
VAGRAGALAGLGLLVASLTVAPVTSAASLLPVASPDTGTVVHGRTRTVAAPGVLANDVLVGVDLLPGKAFAAQLVSGPSHGTLDLDGDGGYVYRADDDFAGQDVFRYRVTGGLLGPSNTTTVTITVSNAAPVAKPDAYDALPDVEITVGAPGLLANDSDADGDALTVEVLTETSNGDLNEDDDGSFRYKADKDVAGTDTFTYRVWDGLAWSNTVTVTIDVAGPSPTRTPTPTTAPTAQPVATPTPAPSARPTPTRPAATPTSGPATLTPRPTGSATPSPGPAASPTAAAPARPSDVPSASPTTAPGGVVPPAPGRVDPPGPDDPGASAAPAPSSPPARRLEVLGGRPSGDAIDAVGLDLDANSVTFGGFEWAVPAFALTVPGLLLILAVLGQAVIGMLWVPVARRWLGGDDEPAARRRAALD